MRSRSGDAELVRRAARRVAVQVAAVVAVAMVALLVVLLGVVIRGENSTADALLRRTAVTADDVGDPPPGTWIVFRSDTGAQSSAGLPKAVTSTLAGAATTAGSRARLISYSAPGGVHFRILTERRDGRTVQVVLNRAAQDQERRHLIRVATVVAAAGLLAAAGIGLVVGRRAVRPLVTALGLQRRFVADAGHELRTPLTLLSTRAQLLERELLARDLDATAAADVRVLVEDVRRLDRVVEDLLVAADPRETQPRTAVDLSALVGQILDSAAARAATVGVELRSDASGTAVVLGVETALRRALLALVDNAIDHTPPGGQVMVTIRQTRGALVLTVADTGPGVAPADADRIFQRFSSGGQRAGRAHYGLGLALTNDVIDRHGGRLRLLPPTPGTGATFEITLPPAPR
ncbi:MAG TPA: HAMP domain-containing sensor histidine kinase [Sporichthyaceae bacterium]